MKLTKKQEAEVLHIHDSYWTSYIAGDVKAAAALLDEGYSQVGSAETEVFFNKRAAVKFLRDTIDQVTGKLEMRNRNTKVEQKGNLVLIHELCDLYALAGKKWIWYSKFRASTLMQKKNNHWKIIHQHSSIPDARTGVGENIAINKITAENQQLREAVKRRTVELEQKSRELEIEASLERVRAKAMGMNKPVDLLVICETLFKEFHTLGFEGLRNAMINIHNDEQKTFINYDYSDEIGQSINPLTYTIHPVIEKQIRQIRKANDAFSKTVFEGKDLEAWKKFRKKIGEKDDPRIKKARALYYYFYSIGTGAIGISTFTPINEEKLQLLKRFRNVFTLSYQRYLDIVQAEAQARESKIETALERVRACTMAMHASHELKEVIKVVMVQFNYLGFNIDLANFNFLTTSKDWTMWLATPEQTYPQVIHVPYKKHPLFDRPINAYRKGRDFMSDELTRAELKSAMHHFYNTTPLAEYDNKKRKKYVAQGKGLARSIIFLKNISLTISNFNAIPYTEEQNAILRRVAYVFKQSYTRFLDLQKAEVQAREATIEAALEKVRSRSLAMHKSDELNEVVTVVFEKLKELGLMFDVAGIQLYTAGSKDIVQWVAALDLLSMPVLARLPYVDKDAKECEIIRDIWKARETGKSFHNRNYSFKEKNRFFQYAGRHNDTSTIPTEVREFQMRAPGYTQTLSAEKHSALWIDSYRGQIISAEEFEVLKRFARVFEQAYVRFLDLKKAEAQAREAQIEMSMERIRATAMAMYSSEDIMKVVLVLREQMGLLGHSDLESSNIHLYMDGAQYIDVWWSNKPLDVTNRGIITGMTKVPLTTRWAREAARQYFSGKPHYNITSTGTMLREWYEYMNDAIPEIMVKDKNGDLIIPEKLCYHFSRFSGGALLMITEKDPSSEVIDVQMRAASVFNLAYQRFLDLQKAEAQAREAQIEVALERVRSRSLAMHNSDELKEVIQVVNEQFVLLNILVEHAGFIIDYKNREDMHIWLADPHKVPSQIVIPYFDSPHWNSFIEAKQKGANFFTNYLDFEEKNKFYQSLFQLFPVPDEAKEYYLNCPGLAISTVLLDNAGLYIENFSGTPYTVEENSVLMRFGKVFQQTYTRFLDLQKAEAQAREAKIEAALERVRSRTMGMQKSEDLREVVSVLYLQLKELGFKWGAASIVIMDPDTGDIDWWMEGFGDGYDLPEKYHVPFFDHRGHKEQLDYWKKGSAYAVVEIAGAEKKSYDSYYFFQTDFVRAPENSRKLMMQQEAVLFSLAYMQYGALSWSPSPLSDEEAKTLQRFAKVFEQSYTRFIDLQKAEAQAREAKIEAALERVRSKALAMHRSDELEQVAACVFESVVGLGIAMDGALLFVFNRDKRSIGLWVATVQLTSPVFIDLPYEEEMKDNEVLREFWSAADQIGQALNRAYSGVVKDEYFTFVQRHNGSKIPDHIKKLQLDVLAWNFTFAAEKNTMLGLDSWSGYQFTESDLSILRRFAKVFEQAYTRFLDLQKAERQTREAQIELAVERVRAKALAMHKSEDIISVTKTLRVELDNLKIPGVMSTTIYLRQEDGRIRFWDITTLEEADMESHSTLDQYLRLEDCPPDLWFQWIWRGSEKYFIVEQDERELELSMQWIKENVSEEVSVSTVEFFKANNINHLWHPTVLLANGRMNIDFIQPPPSEAESILLKMGAAFDLAHKRFLDLQKAEAQAREARIETALEKIRAASMAMHYSNDLMNVVTVLRNQMGWLGQADLESSIIHLYQDDADTFEAWWSYRPSGASDKEVITGTVTAPIDSWWARETIRNYKSDLSSYLIISEGERLVEWYGVLERVAPETIEYDQNGQMIIPEILYYHFSKFSGGALLMITGQEPSSEAIHLQKRAAGVFNLAYQRFKDLQKAEAQARESEIELSLERVRARTMAMHQSSELAEVAALLFAQLKELGAELWTAGFAICTDNDVLVKKWMSSPIEGHLFNPVFIPYNADYGEQSMYNTWKNKVELHAYVQEGEDLKNIYDNLMTLPSFMESFGEVVKRGVQLPTWQKNHVVYYKFGYLLIITVSPFEETQVFVRFAKVFEQTYTRFLDLQKAEAQAREAQIEAALERLRAQTMAMHNSEDVGKCVVKMFAELTALGVEEGTRFGIGILNHDNENNQLWTAKKHGEEVKIHIGNLDMASHPLLISARKAWKEQVPLHHYVLEGDDLLKYYQMLNDAPDYKIQLPIEKLPKRELHNGFIFEHGFFYTFSPREFQPDLIHIIQRFSSVFSQTYRRYLDLVKAEAQSRESQIQLALERVRARTMAMQRSDELPEAANLLFQQVQSLGMPAWSAGYCIWDDDKKAITLWMSSEGVLQPPFKLPLTEDPSCIHFLEAHQKGGTFYVEEIGGEELVKHYKYMRSLPVVSEVLQSINDAGFPLPTFQIFHCAYFSHGFLLFITYEPVPEAHDIFKRFGKVFDQTYTRFLDLQKAETQAREAQIEAALERIRSAAMAMHSSEDILQVTQVLRDQIALLGEKELESILVHIYHEDTDQFEAWYSYRHPENTDLQIKNGKQLLSWSQTARAREDKKKYHEADTDYCIVADYNMLKEWYEYLLTVIPEVVEVTQEGQPLIPDTLYYNYSKIANGAILLITNSVASDHSKYLLRRAAGVFNLAYSRFLDLQKAEAQAREAKIEASLERVRGKAMAMHSSEDLAATIGIFYRELETFSITPRRCGVGLLDKETRMAELSTMNTTEQGDSIEVVGRIKMEGHPVLEEVFDHWIVQQEYHPVLRGNEIKEYYKLLRPQITFPEYPNDAVQYGYFFFFPEGGVYAWTEKELAEDELKIYRRFTSVLSLTYKRYKDLKDAEAREKEAIKQAALDRVRADIASMRSTADLDRITPLIWKELTTLNIPFIRCGVFIMDEKENKVHTYLSTPDGRAIAAYHISMDDSGSLSEAIDHWRHQKIYVAHWVESDFQTQADILLKQGAITAREQYLSTIPKEGFHLHFLPFRQGMLYVGSQDPLVADILELVQSLADAFSVAYARYEDFSQLENAKKSIETTLTELKATQSQLIQSEKMASLGEMTAGIAHEIQNPLNFVNNFSEVSKELLDEMKHELEKGNAEDALQIAGDIIQNLEKINHHGKRADAIVKSMLQHSRKSSGQKELTDINALCDEYLRLAYHGLRAKDKSFNAKFETDLDPTVGKLNVLPQDIGRVILNLINNAFYAVSEKKKQKPDGYEPTVTIVTKRLDDKVEIQVKDNGPGIPDYVKEKIFQPFFTTKPTGQGTGLGLSLSYDIVKAHGGEIKVITLTAEVASQEGSEFIIELPLT